MWSQNNALLLMLIKKTLSKVIHKYFKNKLVLREILVEQKKYNRAYFYQLIFTFYETGVGAAAAAAAALSSFAYAFNNSARF